MALRPVTIFNASGIPDPLALAPTWASSYNASTRAVVAGPAFSLVGGGQWEFEQPINHTGVIFCGANAGIKYYFSSATGVFETFAAFDSSGEPLAGIVPTFAQLKRKTGGAPVALPTIFELGAGIYGFERPGISCVGLLYLGATASPKYLQYDSDIALESDVPQEASTVGFSRFEPISSERLYRDWLPRSLAPGWLQTPSGKSWLTAMGDAWDALGRRALDAVTARLPSYAPADALELIGQERGLPRNTTATDAEYAARLTNSWSLHRQRGTALGVLLALKWLGFTAEIFTLKRHYTLDVNDELVQVVSSWTFDAINTWWTKFMVVIQTSPTDAEVAQILATIKTWKSAMSRGYVAIIPTGHFTWDFPPQTWTQKATRQWDDVGTGSTATYEVL